MKEPFLYEGDKPLKVKTDLLFATVKTIVDSGNEAEFVKAASEIGAYIEVNSEYVNLVKRFLFQKGSHKTLSTAREIVTSASCPE